MLKKTAVKTALGITDSGGGSGDYTMGYMFTHCLGTRSTYSPNFNGAQITYYTQNIPV